MGEIVTTALLAIVIVTAAVFLLIISKKDKGMTKKQKSMLKRILISAAIMLALQFVNAEMFAKLDTYLFPSAGRIARFVIYMIDYLIIGYDILKKAFYGIKNKQVFDESFLMAVATIGAMALAIYENGEYLEAIAVMLFYQIGEWFQSYAVGRSRRNISDLMDIRPDYANVEKNGKLMQIDPDEVGIGSVIVVQPGEKVPIDGLIVEGTSSLNTSALTGESLPREAAVGDEIISGCINLTGVLRIQTTKEFGESTVSKILDLVENASSRKSKSEDFITKFARIYTPAVCYCALALAILSPLVRMFAMDLPADWGTWIYRALTFLVISCPCQELRNDYILESKGYNLYTNQPQKAITALKKAAKEYEDVFMLSAYVPSQKQIDHYRQKREEGASRSRLIMIAAILVSLFIIYFTIKSNVTSRTEELTVYRLIGIGQGSIIRAYLLEMLLITSYTVLPSVLIISAVIQFFGSIPSLELGLIFPWWTSVALIVGLYVLNLLISYIPVKGIISKPPAVLAVKE